MTIGTKLAFFVTSSACYAGIKLNSEQTIVRKCQLEGTPQSAVLVPFIQDVIQETSTCHPEESLNLKAIITPKGPGSFTSIRVTLATAQGLSIACPKANCFAPTLFDVLLHMQTEKSYAVIDSKRGDYFVQCAGSDNPLILSSDQFCEFKNQHSEWNIILEPDLAESDFCQRFKISSTQNQPEMLLESLFSLYNQNKDKKNNQLCVFEPYYLFEPTFKKTNI